MRKDGRGYGHDRQDFQTSVRENVSVASGWWQGLRFRVIGLH